MHCPAITGHRQTSGCLARFVPLLSLVAFLIATAPAAAADAESSAQRVFEFAASGVMFNADFEGARLNDCIEEADGEYRIVIRPENQPVNNSAWYAFRVSARTPRSIAIRLTYEGGSHRYHPQVSSDGAEWKPVPPEALTGEMKRSSAFRVDVGPQPLWISGQEMIGGEQLNAWIDRMAEGPGATAAVIGKSSQGRPIRKLTIATGAPRYCLFIIGRQHPPEVTGTLGLLTFVETIAGPGELAEEFRRTCETVVVPLVNPDGVAAGNWRHNVHGVDLNRDWGPFRQPETQVVRDEILKHSEDGASQLIFFLDFHSTHHDVFYIEGSKKPMWPADFAVRWLDAVSQRLPDYEVRHQTAIGTRPLSKAWIRDTFAIPAVIYEVGDNTDRGLIRQVAEAAAEEMMRLLLAEIEKAVAPTERQLVPAGT